MSIKDTGNVTIYIMNGMKDYKCDLKGLLLYRISEGQLYTYTQVWVKKIVPNKKGDIGIEVHYLCQPNTYVIARKIGEQQ